MAENYIKEKEIPNMPQSIPIEILENLIPKIKLNVCKIECSDGSHGTGFFCNIPFKWDINLKVLMTNNHVLKEEDIKPGKIIKFSLNNDKIFYQIKIDESRIKYTEEKQYDITIIELKNTDDLEEISFFDIDNQINNENPNKIFNNKDIYLLHYPKENIMEYSIGKIKSIYENNYTINHLCNSNAGSSGGPLINTINFQVIGIHKGAAEGAKKYNFGTLLKEPIEKFKEIYEKNKPNKENNDLDNKFIKKKEEEKKKIMCENIDNKLLNNKKNKKIEDEEDIDEIILQYKIDNIKYSKDVRLFGKEFVENNKDKCKIIINGNEFELSEYLNININQLKDNNIFEIKLKGIKQITNMSHMFEGGYNFYIIPISSLLPDISKWNTKNVTDMNCMFRNCKLLTSLPDISNWNTKNIIDMHYMFSSCTLLTSLPDISKWDTQNVKDIHGIFCGCKSLSSLPDISNWNTQNVTDMNRMFRNCESLLSLPDISNWNTQNVKDMSFMFNECYSLSSLPDISKWDTHNVENISQMFFGSYSIQFMPDISKWNTQNVKEMHLLFCCCMKLSLLPDISKWDTKNVKDMSCLFSDCSLLSSLPDLSKWDTKNVKHMNGMFEGCKSLSSLPDLSKWDTKNVEDMSSMFKGCKSLSSLPNLSKWNTKNVTNMNSMFKGCKSLSSLPDITKWDTKKVKDMTDIFSDTKKCIIF